MPSHPLSIATPSTLHCHPIPSVWNPTGPGPTGLESLGPHLHPHPHGIYYVLASSCPTIMTSSWSGLASIQLQQRHSSILSTMVFMYVPRSFWLTYRLPEIHTNWSLPGLLQEHTGSKVRNGCFTWLQAPPPSRPGGIRTMPSVPSLRVCYPMYMVFPLQTAGCGCTWMQHMQLAMYVRSTLPCPHSSFPRRLPGTLLNATRYVARGSREIQACGPGDQRTHGHSALRRGTRFRPSVHPLC